MLPMIPGIVVFTISLAMIHPWGPVVWGLQASVAVAVFVFVYRLNQQGARKLQREIDQLTELLRDR